MLKFNMNNQVMKNFAEEILEDKIRSIDLDDVYFIIEKQKEVETFIETERNINDAFEVAESIYNNLTTNELKKTEINILMIDGVENVDNDEYNYNDRVWASLDIKKYFEYENKVESFIDEFNQYETLMEV